MAKLYCIPTPIAESRTAIEQLPPDTIAVVKELNYFVAENAKSARRFLKQVDPQRDLQATVIRELNEHTALAQVDELLQPLLDGGDAGLLSEAGCPGIADPGALLVALAHRKQVQVVPLIGPCSIVLALMASGLNGQRFSFVGYIAAQPEQRERELKLLERRSAQFAETVLLIETPYRAAAMLGSMLRCLQPQTRVSVCAELSGERESIRTLTVAQWQKQAPSLEKSRVVFGLLSAAPADSPRR